MKYQVGEMAKIRWSKNPGRIVRSYMENGQRYYHIDIHKRVREEDVMIHSWKTYNPEWIIRYTQENQRNLHQIFALLVDGYKKEPDLNKRKDLILNIGRFITSNLGLVELNAPR